MTLALMIDNALQSVALTRVHWPAEMTPPHGLREVWRSRGFLVQVYSATDGVERLSICRTSVDGGDPIAWEDLQRLKAECGRGDREAVEVYPRDCDVVNVANMRHLWVLTRGMPFTWRTP
jgi:hypothetical protein